MKKLLLIILMILPIIGNSQKSFESLYYEFSWRVDDVINSEDKLGNTVVENRKLAEDFYVLVVTDENDYVIKILVFSNLLGKRPYYKVDEMPQSSNKRKIKNVVSGKNYFTMYYEGGIYCKVVINPNESFLGVPEGETFYNFKYGYKENVDGIYYMVLK